MTQPDRTEELLAEQATLLREGMRRRLEPEQDLFDASSAPLLVRYLAHALPESLAYAVERSLTCRGAARQTFREVHKRFQALAGLSLEAVETEAAADGLSGEIALEVLAIRYERADVKPPVLVWLELGWLAVRQDAAAGVAAAQAAWAALIEVAPRFRADLHAPRTALARGANATDRLPIDNLPPELAGLYSDGLAATVSTAEITSDGALRVSVDLPPEALDGPSALSGRHLLLSLMVGADLWPLERAPVMGSEAAWRLAAFGTAFRLPMGEFPPASLRVAVS